MSNEHGKNCKCVQTHTVKKQRQKYSIYYKEEPAVGDGPIKTYDVEAKSVDEAKELFKFLKEEIHK